MLSRDIRIDDKSSCYIIYIDSFGTYPIQGEIGNIHIPEPIPFVGLDQMALTVERLCSRINYPQRTMESRRWGGGRADCSLHGKRDEFCRIYPKIKRFRGTLGTFHVWIRFRDHGSWQGRIVWEEEKKEMMFRSCLELLSLLQEAAQLAEANIGKKKYQKREGRVNHA